MKPNGFMTIIFKSGAQLTAPVEQRPDRTSGHGVDDPEVIFRRSLDGVVLYNDRLIELNVNSVDAIYYEPYEE